MAMNVSLCGPHSLETSTFVPPFGAAGLVCRTSAPLLAMKRYLSHQVGSCEVFAASAGLPAASASANEAIAVRMENLRVGEVHSYTSQPRATKRCSRLRRRVGGAHHEAVANFEQIRAAG